MTTVDQLIERTLNRARGGQRDRLNKLATTVTAASTSIVCTYDLDGRLVAGTVIDIGYERMYVWAVNTGSKTLTVERGYAGTTAAAHTSGDLIVCEPRFGRFEALDAARNEVASWPHDLFAVYTESIVVPAGSNQVTLQSTTGKTVTRLLAVRYYDSAADLYRTPGLLAPRLIRQTQHDATALRLSLGVVVESGADLEVVYGYRPTTTIDDVDDTLASLNWQEGWAEIIELGAAARLISDDESTRVDLSRQGQSRFDESVDARSLMQTAELWRQRADRRIAEEVARLRDLYGVLA